MRPGYRSLFILPAVITMVGCRDHPPTASGPRARAAGPAASTAGWDDRPDEAEMRAFAGRIAGLGGYHFEAGDLVISLTSAGHAAAARAALAGVASRGTGRTSVRPARYTFLQLREWRDAWWERILDVSGVTFVDLDEVANRITIGIAEPAARARVLDLLRHSGIPVDALGFEPAGYPRTASELFYAPDQTGWPAQGDSITSYRRPLEGGLEITYRPLGANPGDAIRCTLGFIAVLNGVRVAITAGHCSHRMWDLDQTLHYQSAPGIGRNIGYEYRDPNASSCGFLSAYVCRHSETSAIALESEVGGSLGYIVRPVGPPPLGTNPYIILRGSLLVDASNPRFQIAGKATSYTVGESADKVGAATGWTSGTIRKTCTDMPADRSWSKLRCQMWADFSSSGGDSGGPVFRPLADGTVLLLGLYWGTVTADGQKYGAFSTPERIEMDLGTLQIMPSGGSGGGGGGGGVPGDGSGGPGGGCFPDCET